eukprot:TRINITY_DN2174_c0_g1_i1.p1 TRINITY_DN2174_c0_g1~~TRINITY_DN2174_c0_g1_i1.p1  ORF type:complete len:687 (+),score=189.22 TRINITY_DN2174_c0_g1_i1:217-2277(+)
MEEEDEHFLDELVSSSSGEFLGWEIGATEEESSSLHFFHEFDEPLWRESDFISEEEGEEEEEEEEDIVGFSDMGITQPEAPLVDASVVEKAMKDYEENPELYRRDDFTCACSSPCRNKFTEREFISMVYTLREMPSLRRKQTASAIMWSQFVRPDVLHAPSSTDGKQLTKRRKRGISGASRAFISYSVSGVKVCQPFFSKLFRMCSRTLTLISKEITSLEGGMVSWEEGRGGKRDIVKEERRKLVDFLLRYGAQEGFPSPSGRHWKKSGHDVILLPSRTSKKDVWTIYLKEKDEDSHSYSYPHFLTIWEEDVPWIKVLKRGSDFCDACTSLVRLLRRSKDESTRKLLIMHLESAKTERENYFENIEKARQDPAAMHITFDFAQHVQVPHDSKEPGKAYFVSGFQVSIFGVKNEVDKECTVFCIPETEYFVGIVKRNGKSVPARVTPKKPSAVASMLVDYINQSVGYHVRHLYMNADNAGGSNKNKTILALCSYLVAIGRFDTITYSFMIAGHTKSAVDGSFGLIKQRFLKEDYCSTPHDFTRIVNECPGMRAREGSDVAWHDWHVFLNQFKIFKPGRKSTISRRHVFVFSRSSPFVCECYDSAKDVKEGKRTEFRVFQDPMISCGAMMNPIDHGFKDISQFPLKIAQISQKRRAYLVDKLRPLVLDDVLEWYKEEMDKPHTHVEDL